MEIEKGCTVLDFAFVLNIEIGVCFAGAKVNDKQVEMDYILEQGDQVIIVTISSYDSSSDATVSTIDLRLLSSFITF